MVSNYVTRALNVASNLTVVSLVQGDLEKLQEAMECTPRGERFDALTEVEINGEIISPLRWAIQDGKISLAKFIIQDLLSIRADRHAYYYGRDRLFQTHPDIVELLCNECPDLLDPLFDGFMWHAHMVHQGKVRVNYYIRELYGSPTEEPNVWKTALGVLSLSADPFIFNHPVVVRLIEVKWNRFAARMYVALQAFTILFIALFFTGFVQWGEECTEKATLIRLVTGSLASVALIIILGLLMSQFRNGLTIVKAITVPAWLRLPTFIRRRIFKAEPVNWDSLNVHIPRYLENPWNTIRCFSYVLLTVSTFTEPCWDSDYKAAWENKTELPNTPEEITLVTALTAVFLGFQLLEVLVLSERLAALTYTIGSLFRAVALNLLVIGVAIFAFGGAVTIVRNENFESLDSAMLNLIKVILGLAPPDLLETVDGQTMFFLIIFVVVVTIGFLNMLVAQLVFAYDKVSAETEGYARMSRAYACCEMESFLPRSLRRRFFESMEFDKPLEYDAGDEGPPGGVQLLEPASVKQHPKYVADRVKRFTGEASPMDPWPVEAKEEEEKAAQHDNLSQQGD